MPDTTTMPAPPMAPAGALPAGPDPTPVPPSLADLFSAAKPTAPPVEQPTNPIEAHDGRTAYRDAKPEQTTQQTVNAFGGWGVNDRKDIAAGALVGQVAQKVAADDPHPLDTDGTRGALWNLQAAKAALDTGKVSDKRMAQLLRSLSSAPQSLSQDDRTELGAKLADFGETARHFTTPDAAPPDMAVARVSDGAVTLTATHPGIVGDLVATASQGMPIIPTDAAKGVALGFVDTKNGLAVVGDNSSASSQAVRTMYPALPAGDGGYRYATRRAIDIADVASTVKRLADPGSEVEVVHGLADDHVAAKPGNYLLVRAPSPLAVRQLKQLFGDVTQYPASETYRQDPNDGLTSAPSPALVVKLPAKLDPAAVRQQVRGALGAGGTAPVLYSHEPMDGWTPIVEHHYVGPAGQAVIHRSQAGDGTNGYPAWMRPADASKLTTVANAQNLANPPVSATRAEDPQRQPDGSYLTNGELSVRFDHLLTGETKRASLTNTLWDSRVDGQTTRAFMLDRPTASLPVLSLGTDPASARAGVVVPTPLAVAGTIGPNNRLATLVAPVGVNGLDLQATANAVALLARYGATLDKRTQITGTDGKTYAINGASHE